MMMIKGTSTGVTGDLHPADRCTWTSVYSEMAKAYLVTNAQFWPGTGTGTPIDIADATSGFIGKSGRFTPISG